MLTLSECISILLVLTSAQWRLFLPWVIKFSDCNCLATPHWTRHSCWLGGGAVVVVPGAGGGGAGGGILSAMNQEESPLSEPSQPPAKSSCGDTRPREGVGLLPSQEETLNTSATQEGGAGWGGCRLTFELNVAVEKKNGWPGASAQSHPRYDNRCSRISFSSTTVCTLLKQ